MTARAFWTVAAGRGEIRTEALVEAGAEAGAGQRLVRTLASGVSRGTEALVFAGRVPESQYAAMRAPLMGGDFPFPVKYGYAAVGRDAEGQRVFVLHPHQDAFLAPAAMCIPVPDTVPTPRAVLAANMETALNIAWDAAALPGERILVVGAGVVGLLTGWLLARIPATVVTLADINPARAAPAAALGCRFALPEAAPGEQELVVHASASEAGLRLALDRAAFEGRIVEASWFGTAAPALPLGGAFHARRLRLIGSQVGSVAPAMRGRRSHGERLATALALLDDPALDCLLEPPTRFAELPRAMPRLLAGGLCHVITYDAFTEETGRCSA
ncbi:MAG: dehydrogenase [Rhodospirillales bacterium 70-18]|nr:zinc-binding alcohol dehydrogenase [Rhodospirillales bacterium]OJY71545.1 MAG: dehydrogenase [Rhodospirillales bacterium 70-18]